MNSLSFVLVGFILLGLNADGWIRLRFCSDDESRWTEESFSMKILLLRGVHPNDRVGSLGWDA